MFVASMSFCFSANEAGSTGLPMDSDVVTLTEALVPWTEMNIAFLKILRLLYVRWLDLKYSMLLEKMHILIYSL